MIKYFILLINFIGFLLVDLFMGGITATINAPDEAAPGSSFTVEITFNISDLKSIGRFKQDLPIGYTATPVNTLNGTFIFKDQIIKIVWNPTLPPDSIFTISYDILVDQTAEGPLVLGGSFTYVDNKELKTLNLLNKTIIIRSKGAIVNNEQNNQQNINNTVIQNLPTDQIFCYRQIVRDLDGITVHILVNTAGLSKDKFGKVQEKILSGYTATNIESKDAIFSFKDNNIKFLWMTLPSESMFQISYKLTATTPTSEIPDISGTFSYVENEGTKIRTIENREFLDNNMLANNQVTKDQAAKDQAAKDQATKDQATKDKAAKDQAAKDQAAKDKAAKDQAAKDQIANNKHIVSPETGVKYKVQIGAYKRYLNVSYFKKLQVTESVSIELNNGLNKYLIGLHSEYKDARDHRVKIWNETPIRDAFVSAYNNGNRITVQEALMIANQKWYQ
ncbi:MAG: hypothetical protein COZ21_02810 [Bacteroidetes bacterium CG_4_10_14_3_um_filter_31_20]|nr:MAG: hypothetical protein COZ21_02810 [Bacteroidetes bacterium CG_4_10_14_3_um_filter_31_20]